MLWKNRDFRRFSAKLALLVLPFLPLLVIYVVCDPFKVLRTDADFYRLDDQFVMPNRDYASTELFLRNDPVYHYDSFIFGSSRSLAIRADDWQQYLQSASAFHFDASNESLYGIHAKVKYLNAHGVAIRNCLITLDADTLSQVHNSDGPLFVKHPAVSGMSRLSFQLQFVKAYARGRFFLAYLDRRIFGKFRPYMKGFIEDRRFLNVPRTNDLHFVSEDEAISSGEEKWYRERQAIFYQRPLVSQTSPQVIGSIQANYLLEIAGILRANRADVRVLIHPAYDQKYLNLHDLEILRAIFGQSSVFDFSGINIFTSDPHNYYETIHYRPRVGRQMLAIAYRSGARELQSPGIQGALDLGGYGGRFRRTSSNTHVKKASRSVTCRE